MKKKINNLIQGFLLGKRVVVKADYISKSSEIVYYLNFSYFILFKMI